MISLKETAEKLAALGRRLRDRRIEHGVSQALLAERLAISIPTLRALEDGQPTVAVGHLVNAMWALDCLDDLDTLFAPHESLLARARAEAKRTKVRQRVRRTLRRAS